jgi:hypothetical protein
VQNLHPLFYVRHSRGCDYSARLYRPTASETRTSAKMMENWIDYGKPGAIKPFMMISRRRPIASGTPMIFGAVSWIVDELIGIRTVEQRLSRRLQSRVPKNNQILLNRIEDLNRRIDLLDRALDEYSGTGKVA